MRRTSGTNVSERSQGDGSASKAGRICWKTIQIHQINAGLQEHKLTRHVNRWCWKDLVLEISNQWRNVDGQESLFCDWLQRPIFRYWTRLSKVLSIVLAPKDPWGQLVRHWMNMARHDFWQCWAGDWTCKRSGAKRHRVQTSTSSLRRLKLGRGRTGHTPWTDVILEGVELFLQRAQQPTELYTHRAKSKHRWADC